MKQKNASVPADFGGSHYYEYDLADLDAARNALKKEIEQWSLNNCVEGVRAIR